MYTRREFFQVSALGSASMLIPNFLQAITSPTFNKEGKKLVIIQLSGGNDGLNTFIPYRNDIYYRARPQLALKANQVLPLSDELGLHPEMEGIRKIYDEGLLSIVNSVGYPNPDRSHFRAMDIWHTASNSDEYWETGWLGRYLDHSCAGCANPHEVIEISETISLAIKGDEYKGLGIQQPKQLKRLTQDPYLAHLVSQHHSSKSEQKPAALEYLYKTLVETSSSLDYIREHTNIGKRSTNYPQNQFAKQLNIVADLIVSGIETSVFYVSLSGFDTHVRQDSVHSRLLKTYSDSVYSFISDLKNERVLDNTIIMTFSEFGRRVDQNASNGTDHGKANALLLMGENLTKPGIFNELPDLSKLDDGDVAYQIDFRSIYATLLENWLKADAKQVLGRQFEKLDVISS